MVDDPPDLARGDSLDPESWFISLRWIAVFVALGLGTLAVFVFEFLPPKAWPRISSGVALLAVLNLVYMGLRKRGKGGHRRLMVQAGVDLILLTALVHFSGGVENPLVLLMLFHVIIAGITLSKAQCFGVASFATALVTILAIGEASGFLEHYTLQLVPHYEEHGEVAHAAYDFAYVSGFVGLQAIVLFLTAYFVTTLAEQLRSREAELAISADHARTQRQLLERSLETTETALQVRDGELAPVLSNQRWRTWAAEFVKDPALSGLFAGERGLSKETLQVPEIRVSEIQAAETDGTVPRTFLATTAPVLDADGTATHVVQLVRDITRQKQAERRMIRAGQLAAVGELAGQVAHEVNNPIAIISAKGRLLLLNHRDQLTEKTESELHKMIALADRVAEIATGLLSYSRPTGALRAAVNLSRPLSSALALIEQRITNAGIEINNSVPSSLPLVCANEKELEQVFLNLLLNALDAMPDGGKLGLSAEVKEAVPERLVGITIRDSGSGIDPEVIGRVFEPFFTTKSEGKGTGLGLSICQGLVEHNGGRIIIESSSGTGTALTVSLPVQDCEEHHA